MAKKLLTYSDKVKPTLDQPAGCGICNQGMRRITTEGGNSVVGRCDCWLGEKLAEPEFNSNGEPNIWRRVAMFQREAGVKETIVMDNVLGLDFIRQNNPDLYRRIPQHIKDQIDAYRKAHEGR